MRAERRHGSRRSLPSVYLMPVPGPSALREAPSGEGGGDEGRQQNPRSGDREPREVGGTSSGTFLRPGCALSQVRDWEGCGPRDGRASGPAGYQFHRSPIEVVGPVTEI